MVLVVVVFLLLADFEVLVDCVLVGGIDAVAWSGAAVLAVLLDVVVGLDGEGFESLSVGLELGLLIDRSPNCLGNWQSLVRLLVCSPVSWLC